MTLFTILCGIALILYGVRCLRKGLDRMLGQRLHRLTERMVSSRLSAMLAGCLFGAAVPSSTTQTVITMQLLQSGKLPLDRMLAFLAGSGVGMTVLLQLIALRIFDYYVVFIALGIALFLFTRNENSRGLGQAFLGGGFLFLAISLISQSSREVAANEDMLTALQLLHNHPGILAAVGAMLGVMLQSSTAVIGLAIGLAEGGAVDHRFLAITVVSANVGLSITTLIVAWPTIKGRILAIANVIMKAGIAGLLLLLILGIGNGIQDLGSPTRMAANLHSGFNVLNAMLGIAAGGILIRVGERLLPTPPSSDHSRPDHHLEPAALGTPVIALANAARETMRLLDKVRRMYDQARQALICGNPSLAGQIKRQEDEVDHLQAAIKNYLSSMDTSEINPNESRLQFGLLHFTAQLEEIADIVDRTLRPAATRIASGEVRLNPSDTKSLEQAALRIDEAFVQAIAVLTTRERKQARILLKEQDRFKPWVIEEEMRHYRVLSGEKDYLEASTAYLSFLHGSRRISGLLKSIGHTFLTERSEL